MLGEPSTWKRIKFVKVSLKECFALTTSTHPRGVGWGRPYICVCNSLRSRLGFPKPRCMCCNVRGTEFIHFSINSESFAINPPPPAPVPNSSFPHVQRLSCYTRFNCLYFIRLLSLLFQSTKTRSKLEKISSTVLRAKRMIKGKRCVECFL